MIWKCFFQIPQKLIIIMLSHQRGGDILILAGSHWHMCDVTCVQDSGHIRTKFVWHDIFIRRKMKWTQADGFIRTKVSCHFIGN